MDDAVMPRRTRTGVTLAVNVCCLVLLAACSDDAGSPSESDQAGPREMESEQPTEPSEGFDGLVTIEDGRKLYLHCSGEGSPTLVLEGGDDDTSESYGFAEAALSEVTRTCVYDRANLGQSDPDHRQRGYDELVDDLTQVLENGEVPGPYVLVGTSGGGYITAGYAFEHPTDVAGMVFVEVPAPFRNPPAEIVKLTRWDSPENVESRDYLQVEKDAWAARREVGDIPVTVISNEYAPEQIVAAEFPSERRGMRANVREQRGWLVLSPEAEQVVVHTGHAVEEADPQLVIDAILEVVEQARA